MAFDKAKFVASFVAESRERVVSFNRRLEQLEKNPADPELVNELFRDAHTLKGTSNMMNFSSITGLAHKMEDALEALRNNCISYSRELQGLLFRGSDLISDLLDKAAAGAEVTADTFVLCEELSRITGGASAQDKPDVRPSAEIKAAAPETGLRCAAADEAAAEPLKAGLQENRKKDAHTVRVDMERLENLINVTGEIMTFQNAALQRLSVFKQMEKLARKNLDFLKEEGAGKNRDEIIRNLQTIAEALKQLYLENKNELNSQKLLVSQICSMSMDLMMLPLSTIFDSYGKLVREVSRACGKEVELRIEGGETEIGKLIIEKIEAPLMHMLRNSVDHGIETPGERLKAGKPPTGVIRLSAQHESGRIVIEISDDGRGVLLQKVREKALQKKLADEAAVNSMSKQELINLIFTPGFSTSDLITDLSGRGVGMDVVRKNIIEDIRGAIDISSAEGKGVSFKISLPLNLATLHLLLFKTGDIVFGLPSYAVKEVLVVPEGELVDVVDRRALRLREQLLPVEDLSAILKLENRTAQAGRELTIIIVSSGTEELGLLVDSLVDNEPMVIKALPEHMDKIALVSGMTIGTNNEVVSILYVPALMKIAKEIYVARKGVQADKKSVRLLVVDDSVNTREIEKSILEANGYEVDLAGDGVEAWNKAQKFRYNLVITDVEMPHMDGFTLTERLRKEENYRDVPIIIVTSREKPEDKRRGISAGADAYIIKGAFEKSNLLDTVRSLIEV